MSIDAGNVDIWLELAGGIKVNAEGSVRMIGKGEDIAFGIAEPCNPCAAGRVPDAVLILRQTGEALEDDALGGAFTDGGDDVLHAPAEEGEGERRKLADFRDANVSTVRYHFECKVVLTDGLEAEKIDVEGTGTLEVAGWNEAHDGSAVWHDRLQRRQV